MNNKKQIKNAKLSDLVVVSSIEQFEFANQFNKNVKIHHWYRYIENRSVEFSKINDHKNEELKKFHD